MALCLLCSCLSALLDLWDLLDLDSVDAAFLLEALVEVPILLLLLDEEGEDSLSEMDVQPEMLSAILNTDTLVPWRSERRHHWPKANVAWPKEQRLQNLSFRRLW